MRRWWVAGSRSRWGASSLAPRRSPSGCSWRFSGCSPWCCRCRLADWSTVSAPASPCSGAWPCWRWPFLRRHCPGRWALSFWPAPPPAWGSWGSTSPFKSWAASWAGRRPGPPISDCCRLASPFHRSSVHCWWGRSSTSPASGRRFSPCCCCRLARHGG